MKIKTARNGSVTITGINAADLRAIATYITGVPYEMPREHVDGLVRLANLFRAAAANPTETIECAPSTPDIKDCWIDEADIRAGVADMAWTGELRTDRHYGDEATVNKIRARYTEQQGAMRLTGQHKSRIIQTLEYRVMAARNHGTPNPADILAEFIRNENVDYNQTEFEWLWATVTELAA